MAGKPTDLTGQTFGRLTVLGPEPASDGRSRWRTRCACGREEVYPRARLTSRSARIRVEACAICRGAPCRICATIIPVRKPARTTCSPACARQLRAEVAKARRAWDNVTDPERARLRRKAALDRARRVRQTSPERVEADRQRSRAAYDKLMATIRADPQARERYLARYERVRAQQRLFAMAAEMRIRQDDD